jgi:hypothetical protein
MVSWVFVVIPRKLPSENYDIQCLEGSKTQFTVSQWVQVFKSYTLAPFPSKTGSIHSNSIGMYVVIAWSGI